jgi:putative ABC transport system substrate-binding protein
MKRRHFITLLGGAAVAWPLAARAQHGVIPIVGYLSGASSDSLTAYPTVFRRGLAEAGYVESQNVEIEYRWAGDQPDRLPGLATELVSRKLGLTVPPTMLAVADEVIE